MENYELNYLYHRVKFMLGLGKTHEARNMVEREVPYVEQEGVTGNFELVKMFLKTFKNILSKESTAKLAELYQNPQQNNKESGMSL